MPIVFGSVRDITNIAMLPKDIELIFQLNDPNLSASGRIHPTDPVIVVPTSSGEFSVDLVDTTALIYEGYYTLSIRWRAPGPSGRRVDFPEWRIRVGPGGGLISDLLQNPATGNSWKINASILFISLIKPPFSPFLTWWKTDPDDPNNLNGKNTGEIYRWENE